MLTTRYPGPQDVPVAGPSGRDRSARKTRRGFDRGRRRQPTCQHAGPTALATDRAARASLAVAIGARRVARPRRPFLAPGAGPGPRGAARHARGHAPGACADRRCRVRAASRGRNRERGTEPRGDRSARPAAAAGESRPAPAGVRRVVCTSSVGALGLTPDGTPADETTPVSIDSAVGAYSWQPSGGGPGRNTSWAAGTSGSSRCWRCSGAWPA
jgi:hypothetical protein